MANRSSMRSERLNSSRPATLLTAADLEVSEHSSGAIPWRWVNPVSCGAPTWQRASRRTRRAPPPPPPTAAWRRGSTDSASKVAQSKPPQALSSMNALVSAIASGPFSSRCVDHVLAGPRQAIERHHHVHETDALRFRCVEPFAGQRVAPQLARGDGIAELRNDDGCRQPPPHLRDGEHRVVGGDDHIAGGDRCRCRRRNSRPARGRRSEWAGD